MGTVGRPRADPRTSTADPQEEILDAAADLFARVGYTAASTRAIAESVGLRQASLFHYYPRKEAILAELLDRTVRPTLDLTRRLEAAFLGPEATLWALAEQDVTNLCRGPNNLGALQLLPEARAEQFAWFWRRRDRLFAFYRRQIRTGTEAGVFPAGDSATAADLVFGLVESVITARPPVRKDPGPREGGRRRAALLGVPPARLERARTRARGFLEEAIVAAESDGGAAGNGRNPMTVVAACQLDLRIGEVDGNRQAAVDAIGAAAGDGAQIVVLPELSDTGYVFGGRDEAAVLADPEGTLAVWRQAAASTGTVVVGGLCDRTGDALVNGAAVVDGSGVLARYAKAHLWDREREVFVAGGGPPAVVDTPFGRLGVMVCYDLEFPEWVRLAAEAGTEILAVPVNWPRAAVLGTSARSSRSRPRPRRPHGGSTWWWPIGVGSSAVSSGSADPASSDATATRWTGTRRRPGAGGGRGRPGGGPGQTHRER